MSNEHHRHLFHHNKANPDASAYESDGYNAVLGAEGVYGSSDYQTGPGYNAGPTYVEQTTVEYDSDGNAKRVGKQHKHLEHVGEFGTAAAGAYVLYEKHEEKKDPEHGHRHKIEEEIAEAAVVGGGGFTFHEKKEEEKEGHGKKHHHLF